MENQQDRSETTGWRRWVPTLAWRLYEMVHGVPDIAPGRAHVKESESYASTGVIEGEWSTKTNFDEYPTDWRGTIITPDARVLYTCDAHAGTLGRSTQIAEGIVQDLVMDGESLTGLTVQILRRSRTGRPGVRSREIAHLKNLANVTVIG